MVKSELSWAWDQKQKDIVVAIIGYQSSIALEFADYLKQHKIKVIIGLNEYDLKARLQAEKDGFQVYSLIEAVEKADIIQVW